MNFFIGPKWTKWTNIEIDQEKRWFKWYRTDLKDQMKQMDPKD